MFLFLFFFLTKFFLKIITFFLRSYYVAQCVLILSTQGSLKLKILRLHALSIGVRAITTMPVFYFVLLNQTQRQYSGPSLAKKTGRVQVSELIFFCVFVFKEKYLFLLCRYLLNARVRGQCHHSQIFRGIIFASNFLSPKSSYELSVLQPVTVILVLACWMFWYMPVIPGFRRLRQEKQEFNSSLGYIVNSRLCRLQGKNISI